MMGLHCPQITSKRDTRVSFKYVYPSPTVLYPLVNIIGIRWQSVGLRYARGANLILKEGTQIRNVGVIESMVSSIEWSSRSEKLDDLLFFGGMIDDGMFGCLSGFFMMIVVK